MKLGAGLPRMCTPIRFRPLSSSAAGIRSAVPFRPRLSVSDIRNKKGFIVDMDGVIYHGKNLLPGAQKFVSWLSDTKKEYLFLTNSSERSPRELSEKLNRLGISVEPSHFYTSALATASFLSSQVPNGSCYVIGEPGLISALYDKGFSMNEVNPDFVVVGETRNYTYERIELAVHLVRQGARLVGTNIDVTDKMQSSFVPACGALIKPIELASGRGAYFVGKPNPIMMRAALRMMKVNRSDAIIIGDRMDTDILGGIQSEIDTALVFSGVTAPADVATFSFRPDAILEGVFAIPDT